MYISQILLKKKLNCIVAEHFADMLINDSSLLIKHLHKVTLDNRYGDVFTIFCLSKMSQVCSFKEAEEGLKGSHT